MINGPHISETSGSFEDAFFFSVQTMATIGYGHMFPITTYGHLLVTAEAFLGLIGFAMGTGLVFSKFSRPTAKVVFSNFAAISRRDGKNFLVFRMANGRDTRILEAQINVCLIRTTITSDGEFFRKIEDLDLVRHRSPVFAFTWTAMHEINESSPLFGVTADDMQKSRADIVLTFSGMDESFSQNVHARHSYGHEKVLWNHKFVDILSLDENGAPKIDFARFHELRPH